MGKYTDYRIIQEKKVILYFYPKDNTAGCTKQACGFSERYPQFTEKGAIILGVSKDSVSSHKRFEEKYGLAFTFSDYDISFKGICPKCREKVKE